MMDEFEYEYTLENSQQFWDELEDIVSAECHSHQLIDNALRSYLSFTTKFKDEYLATDDEFMICLQKLFQSQIFQENKEYVRRQIVYSLLLEDEPAALHVVAGFLLFDGRQNESTFELMMSEGCFPRLVELIKKGMRDDAQLHRLLLELLYEMSRVQRISPEDLAVVDDGFCKYLLQITEELSDDVDDPYHYPVIKVLLVLNEQWMVASTRSPVDTHPQMPPLTNRVIKLLSLHGSSYMTFGENIIILLNRETETALQLLILKLLYLLFTTKATYEYFYTNDLHVLLDVIIRNLLDLPNELDSLRHTYLRVMHPLLAHTQLSQPPHYKRDEILKVLAILGGSANSHWEPADDTTIRLVERVAKVPWLLNEDVSDHEVARKLLGISLSATQTGSTVSVVDVAAVSAEPGVQTPSRKGELEGEHHLKENLENGTKLQSSPTVKVKPPPPTRRRHGAPAPPVIHISSGKIPPKAPPPRRRTKLNPMPSAGDLQSQARET